jgi:hypothetical protein
MIKYNLENVFSFDNDVLIYCDMKEISKQIENRYTRTGITPDSKQTMVLGMIYIKNVDAFKDITNILWSIMNTDQGRLMIDMNLWNQLYKLNGEEYVGILPTWVDGSFSQNNEEIGGIFNPSSIGQFLLGCDNGNPRNNFPTSLHS